MTFTKNIAIVGAGNLGQSLANGLVDSGEFSPEQFGLSRRNLVKLDHLKKRGFKVSSNNKEIIANAEIIVISVLPQKINQILDELKPSIKPNQLIISLVSGVSIDDIQHRLGTNNPIVRVMPNTAIAIRHSMTCIAAKNDHQNHLEEVQKIFDLVGETVIINEEQMTSATALCACGIAFFLRAIRAASQGGNEIDFHAGDALKMAAQTAKGAASLLLQNNSHPEDEIDKVTSPKGCTIVGLNEMEHHGFSSAFIKGITISANKAGKLYDKT